MAAAEQTHSSFCSPCTFRKREAMAPKSVKACMHIGECPGCVSEKARNREGDCVLKNALLEVKAIVGELMEVRDEIRGIAGSEDAPKGSSAGENVEGTKKSAATVVELLDDDPLKERKCIYTCPDGIDYEARLVNRKKNLAGVSTRTISHCPFCPPEVLARTTSHCPFCPPAEPKEE